MFGRMFGKKGDKALTAGEAIQKLRETEEMLMKKQEYLEKKIEQETAAARKNAKTNKRIALQALKRKKNHEKKLQQIDGTLTTLEYQRTRWTRPAPTPPSSRRWARPPRP